MRELVKLINSRGVDNTQTGTVIAQHVGNPQLYTIQIPNGRTLTLASTSVDVQFIAGDYVEIARPSGDQKRAYLSNKAALVVAGDAFNRVLGLGTG